MRKQILYIAVAVLVCHDRGFAQYSNSCFNVEPPDECDDVGANPIKAPRANLRRYVTDLTTFGNAPVEFTRIYNSRTTDFNSPYWELGAEQTWQHNWNFEMRDIGSRGLTNKVRYPSGLDINFIAADTNAVIQVPPAYIGDRLYKWTGGRTLVTPSGWEYDFKHIPDSSKYTLEEVRNGQGLSWKLVYNSSNQLHAVTNCFGRWISISRETGSNGIQRISKISSGDGREVTYSYSNWVDGSSTDSVLTAVNYPAGAQAQYAYVHAETNNTGRALLATASDPQYAGAGARVKYVYNYNNRFYFGPNYALVTGSILEERNLSNDDLIVSLPTGSGEYPQILLGDGTEVTRKYNGTGLLTEMRDGEGRTTTYTRDQGGFGFIGTTTNAEGAVTSSVRDYAGRVLTNINALGFTNSFAYNTAGFVLTNTDALGRSMIYTRTSSNLVTRIDHADGSFETWDYNQYGQVLTNQLRNGGTVTMVYYASGQSGGLPGDLKTTTDALGNTSTYTWNSAGLMAGMIDPRGNTNSLAYDWRGLILTNTHADATTVIFKYDTFGNRTNVIDELGHVTAFTYDEYNRMETVTDALGRTTTYEYGRAPGCGGCGSVNLMAKITDPAGHITTFSYDGSDKRTNETTAAGTTSWSYDSVGRQKTQTDANGNTYTWAYDLIGRTIAETNALSQVTRFGYDAVGNRTNRVDGAGITTFWTYDSMNRVSSTGSGTLTYEYGYDLGGRRTNMNTKINGSVTERTTYTFDARNLMLSKADPTGFTLSYGYDSVGNRTNLLVAQASPPVNPLIQSYVYDTRNRVTTMVGNSQTTTFAYDAASRRIAATWPNSSTATNSYDNANELLSLVHKTSGGFTIASFAYGYDLAGNRTNMTTLEGVNSYSYNSNHWLTAATYPGGRTQQFRYDAVGNRTNLVDSGTGVSPVAYSYDAANRLLSAAATLSTNTYLYDGAGRLTNSTTSATVYVAASFGSGVVNGTYAYSSIGGNGPWGEDFVAYGNSSGRYLTHFVNAHEWHVFDNPVDGDDTYYDRAGDDATGSWTVGGAGDSPAGTVTAQTVTRTEKFAYDFRSQMTSLTDTNGDVFVYDFDGDGNRTKQVTSGCLTSRYVYDGPNVVLDLNASNQVVNAYVNGPGIDQPVERIAFVAGTQSSRLVYHTDGLGSVIAMTDSPQSAVKTYTYEAFGRIRSETGLAVDRYTYTGREAIGDSLGLYYYRWRVMDPNTGRFISEDPLGFWDSPNVYCYVDNAPQTYIDPSGLSWLPIRIHVPRYKGPPPSGPEPTAGKFPTPDGPDALNRCYDACDKACAQLPCPNECLKKCYQGCLDGKGPDISGGFLPDTKPGGSPKPVPTTHIPGGYPAPRTPVPPIHIPTKEWSQ